MKNSKSFCKIQQGQDLSYIIQASLIQKLKSLAVKKASLVTPFEDDTVKKRVGWDGMRAAFSARICVMGVAVRAASM